MSAGNAEPMRTGRLALSNTLMDDCFNPKNPLEHPCVKNQRDAGDMPG